MGSKINKIITFVIIVVAILCISIYFNNTQSTKYINAQLSQYYDSQETTYYCAPASVRMVLEYINYSPIPSQTQLAVDMNCKAEYSGIQSTSSILIPFIQRNLTSYDWHYGMSFNSALADVKSHLQQGDAIILGMWFDERKLSGHFIVAYGYDLNGIFINDPWDYGDRPAVGRDYGLNAYVTNEQLEPLWSYNSYWYVVYG